MNLVIVRPRLGLSTNRAVYLPMVGMRSGSVFSLGQTPPAASPPLTEADAKKQQETILRNAAKTMIDMANSLVTNLDSTYQKYQDVGTGVMSQAAKAVAAGTYVTAPPVALAVSYYVWSNALDAVQALSAISHMAFAWMTDMSEKFLPSFIDQIQTLDVDLANQIDLKFGEVESKNADVVQLLGKKELLPELLIPQLITKFFMKFSQQMVEWTKRLMDLMNALAALMEAFGRLLGAAAKFGQAEPYIVLGVLSLVVGYFVVKS